MPDLIRYPGTKYFENELDFCLQDCVAIDKTTHISLIVIPGLTRNPVLIQWLTILDAGSSPA